MLHPGDPTFDSPSIEEFDMVQPAIHHWETVKRLHQFALDKDPSDRTAFVRFMARFAQDFVTHSIGRRPVAVS